MSNPILNVTTKILKSDIEETRAKVEIHNAKQSIAKPDDKSSNLLKFKFLNRIFLF